MDAELQRSSKVKELTRALEVTRDLVPLAKEKLISIAKKVIRNEPRASFNQEIFLKVLGQVMGIPTKI